VGTKAITFKDANASSTAANRFELKNDISIQSQEGALIVYDMDILRWIAIAINT